MKTAVKMTNTFKKLALFCNILFFLNVQQSSAQNNPWQTISFRANITNQSQVFSLPNQFKSFQLDLTAMDYQIGGKSATKKGNTLEISIPNPSGEFEVFMIKENSIVAAEVAHLYDIKTYTGYKKTNPSIQIQCDFGINGFHALILANDKTYIVEPILKNDLSLYQSYYRKDNLAPNTTFCKAEEMGKIATQNNPHNRSASITQLRTFRLVLVSAGEFSQEYGGNPYSSANVLAALATLTNIANGIYKRDLGIEFSLVSTAAVVFEDPNTDAYDPTDASGMADQCQSHCNTFFGNANYDIGHVVTHGNYGGIAVAAACVPNNKARGFSSDHRGLSVLATDYLSHELGHQLGASHTFSSQECGTSEDDYRYEPGEGSSLMAYAGVCGGAASYQNFSDPFFHSASIDEINDYVDVLGSCHSNSTPGGGNSADPVVNAGADLIIPKQTPFVLVGNATDANDAADQLTYIWEQFDGSSTAVSGSPDCNSTSHPLFRFYPPSDSGNVRVFPEMSNILTGQNNAANWEKLPCVARDLNFRMAVRDNNINWGRFNTDETLVTVANTGPFNVTSPNGEENFSGNATETVTWTVNSTDSHCPNVDVLISTDSGQTWTNLVNNVPNNGSANVTIPTVETGSARILVQCHTSNAQFREASTFFDASDANFSISSMDSGAGTGEEVGVGGEGDGTEANMMNDVYLTQSVNTDSVGIGDTVIFTIKLFNELNTNLTNVQVTDILPMGLNMTTYTSSAGTTYNGTIWDIGSIANTVDSLELAISAVVMGDGTFSNVAELTQMTETDQDSTPNNQDFKEDDIAMACVRTAIRICPMSNDTVTIEATTGLTDYQWYKDGTPISPANGGTDSIYHATMAGKYTWEASLNGCPTTMCCPVELEESEISANATTTCFNNNTNNIDTDDTFSIVLAATNELAGSSNKYLVIYDGNTLNDGGTVYNSAVILNHNDFVADGVFSPVLTIRDFDDAACEKEINVPATAACSDCPTTTCLPITATRKARD